MSRSFKKNPIEKKGGLGKKGKRLASKRVRRFPDVLGVHYKKLFSGFDIHDHIINGYIYKERETEILRNK